MKVPSYLVLPVGVNVVSGEAVVVVQYLMVSLQVVAQPIT